MPDKITNELILDEIRKSRQDVKATIQALETRICLKIEETNHRLNILEKKNNKFEELHEEIKRKLIENNIVIYGLGQTPNKISLDYICNELKRLIDVDIHEAEVNNFYSLGKEENCPVKVEFVSCLKKVIVLKNTSKLKGTNVYIANDLTVKQREENKILRRHLQLAKQNKNHNSYIKRNKLFINDQIYTAEQLEYYEVIEGSSDKPKLNSAPATPAQEKPSTSEPAKKLENSVGETHNQQLNFTLKDTTRNKYSKEVQQSREGVNNERIRTRSTNAK